MIVSHATGTDEDLDGLIEDNRFLRPFYHAITFTPLSLLAKVDLGGATGHDRCGLYRYGEVLGFFLNLILMCSL